MSYSDEQIRAEIKRLAETGNLTPAEAMLEEWLAERRSAREGVTEERVNRLFEKVKSLNPSPEWRSLTLAGQKSAWIKAAQEVFAPLLRGESVGYFVGALQGTPEGCTGLAHLNCELKDAPANGTQLYIAPQSGERAGEAVKLAKFGHHPNPAVDFCVEVESILSELENRRIGFANGTPSCEELDRRIEQAMAFRVGGVEHAVRAKQQLRDAAKPAAPGVPDSVNAEWVRWYLERILRRAKASTDGSLTQLFERVEMIAAQPAQQVAPGVPDAAFHEAIQLLRSFQSNIGAWRPEPDDEDSAEADDAATWDRIDAVCNMLAAQPAPDDVVGDAERYRWLRVRLAGKDHLSDLTELNNSDGKPARRWMRCQMRMLASLLSRLRK